jgi:chemotaxis protein methyltransferase CheR
VDENNKISNDDLNRIFEAKLTDAEFEKLSRFIHSQYGIKMPPVKKIMLQSRLQKRLRVLKIASFKIYIEYVFSDEGRDEIIHMMDVVSTNKTDFFRESAHFDFIKKTVMPEFLADKNQQKTIKVWSAGSSSGEEAYTIAMVLTDYKMVNPNFDFHIYGTDLSTRILKNAIEGIYSERSIVDLPMDIRRRYFLKSKDSTKQLVRIIPELRQKTKFERLNFMDDVYPVSEVFDIIFCRNVLIYFDRETQESVISKLCRNLRKDGYFFLGHSESITGINVPLKHIQPTVFKRI